MLNDPDEHTLRAIGLLYLVCAHGSDDDLHEAERDTIVHKIEGRIVSSTEETVAESVRNAVQLYKAQPNAAAIASAVHEAAAWLATRLSLPDRKQVVEDLADVARADGVVSSPERDFILDASRTFGVDTPTLP